MFKETERIDSLQFVRTIAFLGVYLYHAVKTFPGQGRLYEFFSNSPGPWGVSVFFTLSGFLMTYSYWNRGPDSSLKGSVLFSLKKIRKLYPLHLVMLFLGTVYWLLRGQNPFILLKRLAIAVPLVQTWFPEGYRAINSVAWYFSVCLFLYFCFPSLLSLIKKKIGIGLSLVGLIAIFLFRLWIGSFVFQYLDIDIKWATYYHPVFRLGDFVIGGFLASIYIGRKENDSKHYSKSVYSLLEFLAIVLNIAACILFVKLPDNAAWFKFTSLFVLSSVIIVYFFSLNAGIMSDLLTNRVTFWFARISPYAFLIHRLVIYYFYSFSRYVSHDRQINWIIVVTVPFLITVLVVYLYLFLAGIVKRYFGNFEIVKTPE